MRKAFADGIGWGDAKQKLFERIDAELAPMRERYEALIAQPGEIEEALHGGGERARALSQPLWRVCVSGRSAARCVPALGTVQKRNAAKAAPSRARSGATGGVPR